MARCNLRRTAQFIGNLTESNIETGYDSVDSVIARDDQDDREGAGNMARKRVVHGDVREDLGSPEGAKTRCLPRWIRAPGDENSMRTLMSKLSQIGFN
jgi:hypothetical protein